ncbi:MAG: glycosyltransferase family 2 protein [Actinomycetota bacterium]
MSDYQSKTPIAFIIFKRPDTTARVFETIRQVQPPKLLVVADGPRPDRPGEETDCAATRAIIDQVDWKCEVLTNYADTNLGCRQRVSSGLDWIFDTVEEAIILEDDCLPHPTFFPFAEELLNRYRDDERIMAITGTNVQWGRKRTDYSYYFSRYNHCWGWASWRRAWQHYDLQMKLWPEFRDSNYLEQILVDAHAVKSWTKTYQLSYEQKLNTWDFQWTFACWVQSGLTIIPNGNLVSNIGYGAGSTHTEELTSPYSNMAVEAMTFPLQHPPFVVQNREADDFTEKTLYDYNPTLCKRVQNKIRKTLKLPVKKYG